jgi:TolB-like protein/Tfp pilus assembly protein PilF
LKNLLNELKRRNVFKVAVLYAVTGWLILQAADVLLDLFGIPDWGMKLIAVLLALGFLPAVIISWVYEMTPEGIKKEADVDRSQSVTDQTGAKINFVIAGLLAITVGLLAYEQWAPGDKMGSEQISQAKSDPSPDQPAPVADPEPAAETPEPEGPSLAVLPFKNMSSDPEQEFFSEGLSDTLIHVLAQIKDLKVAARTSSFAFKDKEIDVRDIAGQLGVAAVLEGSVQKAGTQMRIIAQLIDAADGTHLWSGTFDRSTDNIFAIQDEIAQEVVKALKITLLSEEESRLANRHQPTLEAYEQFLLGRKEMAKRLSATLEQAQAHFQKAVELDPEYALAYVNLGDSIWLQQEHGEVSTAEAMALVEPIYAKALALQPDLGELQASLGMQAFNRNENDAGHQYFQRAIELSPNYATAYHWYAIHLDQEGKLEEAYQTMLTALELDPLSDIVRTNLIGYLRELGDIEASDRLLDEGLERSPEFTNYHVAKGAFLMVEGKMGEAIRWIRHANEIDPGKVQNLSFECSLLFQMPDPTAGQTCAENLYRNYPEKESAVIQKMVVMMRQQDFDGAIQFAQKYMEGKPAGGATAVQDASYYAHFLAGRWLDAKSLLAELNPELLDPSGAKVHRANYDAAIDLAYIYLQTDKANQAAELIKQTWPFLKEGERFTGIGFWIEDVRLHAMEGNLEQAKQMLAEAIEMGWRGGWYHSLFLDPVLRPLHQDPEYQELVAIVETDMQAQQQWLSEHADEPVM